MSASGTGDSRRPAAGFAMPALMLLLGIAGTYALTAGNVVPATRAGDGQGTVSGYTAGSVHYTLNTTDPGNVDSVTFTLDSAPVTGSTVRIRLNSAGGAWYACTWATTNVTCDTTVGTQATVASADALRVVVSQ